MRSLHLVHTHDDEKLALPDKSWDALFTLAWYHGWQPKELGLDLSEADLEGLDEEMRAGLLAEAQELKDSRGIMNWWADFSYTDSNGIASALERALPYVSGDYRKRWTGDLNENIVRAAISFFRNSSSHRDHESDELTQIDDPQATEKEHASDGTYYVTR